MPRETPEIYEFGRYRLDVGEHKLVLDGGTRNGTLPEKAFRTLIHLVRNSGKLVLKDELLAVVWPDAVEENNLGKAVHAIRHFFKETNGDQTFIETVPKHGYRFTADVSSITDTEDSVGKSRDNVKTAHTRSPAYSHYIRAKVKVGSVKRSETEAAIELLEEAIAIDPDFAEAYAQLARAYIRMAFNFSEQGDGQGFLERAEVAIEEALTLKPDLAEGHFARGLIIWTHINRFPHEQAIQAYKRSLECNPNADETHLQLSMVYGHIGLMQKALQSVMRAIELNPNNTMARFRVSNYLAWQGKPEEALAVLKTVPSDVSPLLFERVRAEALIQAGRLNEATAVVEEYLSRHPRDEGGSLTSVQALLFARSKRHVEAEKAIKHAVEIGKAFGHFHHTAYNVASAYAALKKPVEAVKWLEFATDNGFPNYNYIKLDPNLEDLRRDRHFNDLLSTLRRQWEHFQSFA